MFYVLFHMCFIYMYLPIRIANKDKYVHKWCFIQHFCVSCTSLEQTSRMEINGSAILIFLTSLMIMVQSQLCLISRPFSYIVHVTSHIFLSCLPKSFCYLSVPPGLHHYQNLSMSPTLSFKNIHFQVNLIDNYFAYFQVQMYHVRDSFSF